MPGQKAGSADAAMRGIEPMVLAAAAVTAVAAALGAAELGVAEGMWGQVQLTVASVAGVAITVRGWRLAADASERAVRRNFVLAAGAWLVVQVLWLIRGTSPGAALTAVELVAAGTLVLAIGRTWHLALRQRFTAVEAAAVCLDSAAVFLTIGAGILLAQGSAAMTEPASAPLLAYAVLFGGLVGAVSVLYLAITPVRKLSGGAAALAGLVLLGSGMLLRIESRPGWDVSDLLSAVGVLVTAYGCATWTAAIDPSQRFRRVAHRIRATLPLAAVGIAPVLLVVNELLLPETGAAVGMSVDASLALVFVVSVVRLTLLSREQGRTLRDATESAERERRLLEDLQASEQRFRTLVQNSSDVFLILHPDGRVDYQSPAVERVLGYPPGERLGREIFELTHPEDVDFVRGAMAELMQTPGAQRTIELRSRHADGSWRTIEATAKNMVDDPMVSGIVVNYRDVTERRTLELQLIHEAFHDPLTGLANRALFTDRVEHALSRRDDIGRLAVLFMDVDDFKTINDSLGHAAGDLVLVAVAERLRACLRPEDTVSRMGGDEFAVLLEDADSGLATQVAARLLDTLRMPFDIAGKQVHLAASIGVAFGSPDTRTANEMLRNADVAMYTAKNRGKGRLELFEASMHTAVLTRLELKGDLEKALEQHEFRLRYQPVFDLHTGRLAGFEALLRWRHPVRGEIFPADFIGLAEETGLIVPIGQWVLTEACRQAKAWTDAGHGRLEMSVNLSPRQVREADLVSWVADSLAETGLQPELLILELTESSLMQDDEGRLRDLRNLGVRLALDDFGTGYSSLSYLSRFPIDLLKIDRTFTAELGGEVEESALVRSVVQLAGSMSMRTVAEGIESPEQLARVAALGCDFGQGFLLARPMDAIRATALAAAGATIGVADGVAIEAVQ
jgi:diguanylate cyclase (GGDEF)-like protein/PAS domain S-box-containing protein